MFFYLLQQNSAEQRTKFTSVGVSTSSASKPARTRFCTATGQPQPSRTAIWIANISDMTTCVCGVGTSAVFDGHSDMRCCV
eukprot:m.63900 g.63900  ORF g.63900 m.63900 type:complete len:81 (+) comp17815_c0_seq5:4932-5174(+)